MENNFDELEKIQDICYERTYWEDLRHFYKPEKIRLLIIGEDIPDGGKRFFYYDKVKKHDYLFLDTMKAIFPEYMVSYKVLPERKRALLKKFQDMGCYLIDYYKYPKSMIQSQLRSGSWSIYEKDFLKEFAQLNLSEDCKIVVLSAVSFVGNMMEDRGYDVYITPYRGGDKNEEYITILRAITSHF